MIRTTRRREGWKRSFGGVLSEALSIAKRRSRTRDHEFFVQPDCLNILRGLVAPHHYSEAGRAIEHHHWMVPYVSAVADPGIACHRKSAGVPHVRQSLSRMRC